MTREKKTTLTGCSGQGVEATQGAVALPCSCDGPTVDYNTGPAKVQQATANPVWDILPIGRENAVSAGFLCAMLGLSARALRTEVANERNRGKLIIASPDRRGYYKPENTGDVLRLVDSMRNRGLSCLRVASAARRALQEMQAADSGQMRLDGLEAAQNG